MFFVNNQFGETIIKKNMDKIKSSSNAVISDKFLKETIMLNIISLAKTREVIIRKCGTTNHDNHWSAVNNTINVLKLVQLLVNKNVFEK